MNDHRRSGNFVLLNFRVLSSCLKIFSWSRIPTKKQKITVVSLGKMPKLIASDPGGSIACFDCVQGRLCYHFLLSKEETEICSSTRD